MGQLYVVRATVTALLTGGCCHTAPARPHLSLSEYILAYSSLTSSKLLGFPSCRLKNPIRDMRVRVIKRKQKQKQKQKHLDLWVSPASLVQGPGGGG